jgi:hypothetical protein
MREGLFALEMSAHKSYGFMRACVVLALASGALVAVAFALSAEAAEIRTVRGQVLINEGAGYRVIEGAVRLKAGDAAMAAPQGLGSLSYDDGCTIDVRPGTIAWIGTRSPCTADEDRDPSRDPVPVLQPRVKFDPNWLRDGAALIDGRKPAAGP